MAACSLSVLNLSISDRLSTSKFPPPAFLGGSSCNRVFHKGSQCRQRKSVAVSARNALHESLSARVVQTKKSDCVPPPIDCKEDSFGRTTSRVIIIGAMVGSFCLTTPALANFQSYDHAEMRGANMSGQNLSGAVFAACDCRKIDLSGSNLDGTTDTFAGFQGADLRNTSWIRAFADRVVFREANLQNANFTNAVLSGSQFDGADITGADFTDALIDNYQRLKMCKKANGTNPVTGIETRESLFCK